MDFREFDHRRFRWEHEDGFLATSGCGIHSNVQINLTEGMAYDDKRTALIPLWWFFRGRPA